MIFLCSNQTELFRNDILHVFPEEAVHVMRNWEAVQYDSETSGKDAHIDSIKCIQFGNIDKSVQIIVDTETVDIQLFKEILETKLLIAQNAKFDLQFLYKHNIKPLKVWDTMIMEQLIYLGYPSGVLSYSLVAIADRRLDVYIDKSVRGSIIYRGLDYEVIKYAANDVVYLYDIMQSQMKDIKERNLVWAAEVENAFVPVIAYLEWCGIKLDKDRWKRKMEEDRQQMLESVEKLNQFLIRLSEEGFSNSIVSLSREVFSKYVYVENQGDLFNGFDLTPKVRLKWTSPRQVVELAKLLGFDTAIKNKKGEDTDSVLEKVLKKQKGICDEFLSLYFEFREKDKVVSSFGQGHINSINPITGRIHTVFRQLGTRSGRMASGSQENNNSLEVLKKIKPITYPNLQQLPADERTRSCFIAEKGNLFCSCDYSALESRLGADIYNEPAMVKEYIEGSGDIHSLVAKKCFADELEGIEVKDIKKLRPDLRKKAKGPEFAMQFDK